jgi:hypothetical protein
MKVLVCIMAQVRFGEPTWDKFKENVLDELGADLALCISDAPPKALGKLTGEQNTCNSFYKHAKYKFQLKEPAVWMNEFEKMAPEITQFKCFPGNWLETGGMNTYFRWFLYQNLKANGLLDVYDQIIITRSDYFWQYPHPKLDNDHVWVPDGEFHGGLCDRHMVIPTKWAEEYLAIGSRLRVHKHFQKLFDFYRSRPWAKNWMLNNESYLWFRYTDEGLHERIAFFPQRMYTITAKYPDEFIDTVSKSDEFTTWPWTIEHTHLSPNGLFRGRLKK